LAYASFGRRLAGACIDAAIAYMGAGALVGGLLLSVSIALEDIWRIFDLAEPEPVSEWIVVSIVVAATVACWIGYLGVSNGTGASVGKQILELRLIDGNGDTLGIRRGVARAVISLLFLFTGVVLIDFAWILFNNERRTLHDRLVGSYVVYS
jgi:uncharacterized RDD family membrane protein YckC